LHFKFKIYIIFAILFIVFAGYSQDSYKSIQPIEYAIQLDNYSSASNERQLLTSLSINNIKNIHLVRLYFNADLLLNVQKDEYGHLYAYIKAVNSRMSGDMFFRDFLLDSLLTPTVFEGKLTIESKEIILHEMPIEMLLTGGVLDLEMLEKYSLNIDELTFNIVVDKLMFSDQQLAEFMNMANLINSYYSYNEVLKLLLERYSGNQISRVNSSAATFIAWHHIHRVNSFIATYAFPTNLNLDKNDPKGFAEKKVQLDRLEERASTLFTKELEKGKKGKLLERNEYCQKYVDISNDYIKLSKNYQPNTVSAFNELVQIFPAEEDLNRMIGVAAFYDVFKITNVPSTYQLIFNNFVSSADSTLKRQEYLNTLNLIRNASEIETFFNNVEISEKFYEVYAEALNGLMSSFLKVSVMAYKSRNFKIAKRYYQQAQQIYDENADFIGDDFRAKHSFEAFVEKQVELAGMMLDDNYFEDAIGLLDQAKTISEENDIELDDFDFSAAYKKGYAGIYNILLDSIDYHIQQQNKNNGLSILLQSAEFDQSHSEYLKRDERVISYATILFDHYMNTGLKKLHGEKPEEALKFLFEARNLNEVFQLDHAKEIDSAVSQAIVPLIIQMINKAEFEVWAKRLAEAKILKEQAENTAINYGLIEQEDIRKALLNLDEKINNRVCIDIQYKVNNACKIAINRIHSGKIKEGEIILKEADDLINAHPECEVDQFGIDSLMHVYQPLFKYIAQTDSLDKLLGNADFSDIKKLSDELQANYNANGLNEYLGKISTLFELMKEKGSVPEYYEAIQYHIDQDEFLTAFYYLELLQKNGVSAKNTKQYQKEIGYGICKEQADKHVYLDELVNNDSWYKILKASCLKN
jgi:hypothetical protein